MSVDFVKGVITNQDLSFNLIKQNDALPSSVKRKKFYQDSIAIFILFFGIAMVLPYAIFSANYEILFLAGISCYFLAKKNKIKYVVETPAFEDIVTINNPLTDLFRLKKPKLHNVKKGKGVLLLGLDKERNSNVMIGDSDCRKHLLVMGTTGSGKTRFLMSILYQSMVLGSGCIYVDGKADNSVFWYVYSLCQRLDRIDDLRLINYLTTSDSQLKEKNAAIRGNKIVLTNTLNPYAYGDSESLKSMTVGLMRDSGGGDGMWKGRASSLVSAILRFLTYLRDEDYIDLSVTCLRDMLNLDNIVKSVFKSFQGNSIVTLDGVDVDMSSVKMEDYCIRSIVKYLKELPGYNQDDMMNEITEECSKQHNFLTMQLTEALSDLSETYGHIFSTPIGEVDFQDLVFSRRVLFVMLPALQRDIDSLQNLGKLIVAAIRGALAPTLGNSVEGLKAELIDSKPTNSDVPFFIILDEYGYYAVKGFAVVAAQARSLGISVVFAGQDYAGFKRGSPEEAESILANTNTKVAMTIDEENTLSLFIKGAGKKFLPVTKGVTRKYGMLMNKNVALDRVDYEERDVISSIDLMKQNPGEAHVLIKGDLMRVNLFSFLTINEGGQSTEVEGAVLNKYIIIRKPKARDINILRKNKEKIKSIFNSDADKRQEVYSINDIDRMKNQFDKQIENNQPDMKVSAITSIASLIMNEFNSNDDDLDIFSNNNKLVDNNILDDIQLDQSLFSDASNESHIFEELMNKALKDNGESTTIREKLIDVANICFDDENKAKEDAEKSLKSIEESFSECEYPSNTGVKNTSRSTTKRRTNNLLKKIENATLESKKIKNNKNNEDSGESDKSTEDFFNQ